MMLEIKNLSARRGRNEVLSDISMNLPKASFTALLGRNGSGKSTLVSCINHTLRYSGDIYFCGELLAHKGYRERSRLISVLPQILPRPHITVEELVMLGRSPHIAHHPSRSDKEYATRAIEKVGLTAMSRCFADELSGGESRKAYLAMTLARNTELVVLDEPTTYMDAVHENEFFRILSELVAVEKKTLLVVMHDISLAVRFADRIAVLDDRRLVFEGETADCLSSEVLEKTFGVRKYETEGKTFFSAQ